MAVMLPQREVTKQHLCHPVANNVKFLCFTACK